MLLLCNYSILSTIFCVLWYVTAVYGFLYVHADIHMASLTLFLSGGRETRLYLFSPQKKPPLAGRP
jgi:hypothetical protein